MKKALCLILTAILCCLSAVGLAYPALEDIGDYAVVNNPRPQDRLNLRTGPDSSYDSLGKYYNGTVCEILDGGESRSWVKVRIYPSSVEGWMMTRYLAFGSAANQVASAKVSTVVNNASGLNMRSGPGTGYGVFETLKNGTGVTVMGVVGEDWAHVQAENLTGYVMTRYLKYFQSSGGSGSGGSAGQTGIAYVKNTYAWQRLNLRARPSLNSDVLGRYQDGVKVSVLASMAGGWAYVRVGGRTGYMMTKFLTFDSPSGGGEGSYSTLLVSNPVYTQKLNLRTGPGSRYASLGFFCNGLEVSLLESRSDGWAKVQVGSLTGYMDSNYLANPNANVRTHFPAMRVSNPVSTHRLNLRQSPSVNSTSLARCGNGTQVEVLGYLAGDEWVYVRVKLGQEYTTGYMMLKYLR